MSGGVITLVAFALLQFTGPARTNPIADAGLRLEAQATLPDDVRRMIRRACYDCHSDETRWPWYSRIAPVSWLVIRDVDAGRAEMNFSRWGGYHKYDRADLLDKGCELARKGEMPLPAYVRLHPEAKLTMGDLEMFCAWSEAEAARLAGEEEAR